MATVYAAPSALRADAPNRLERVRDAPGIVTDGAFFPDGRHLVLRNYGRAFVLSFPSLDVVGDIDLPAQKQGEGIAVAPDETIYASSEGMRSAVLRIALPADIADAMRVPSGSDGSSASPTPSERRRVRIVPPTTRRRAPTPTAMRPAPASPIPASPSAAPAPGWSASWCSASSSWSCSAPSAPADWHPVRDSP